MANLITQTDLGTDFVAAEPGPVAVNIDGVCLTRNVAGELTVVKSTLAADIPNNSLVLSHADGTSQTVDLTSIVNQLDINLQSGSYDAATMILTLTDTSGPDVTIPLGALMGVSTDAGNVLSNGADSKPFLGATDICDVVKSDCVANPGTPCTDLAGNVLGYFIAP